MFPKSVPTQLRNKSSHGFSFNDNMNFNLQSKDYTQIEKVQIKYFPAPRNTSQINNYTQYQPKLNNLKEINLRSNIKEKIHK